MEFYICADGTRVIFVPCVVVDCDIVSEMREEEASLRTTHRRMDLMRIPHTVHKDYERPALLPTIYELLLRGAL